MIESSHQQLAGLLIIIGLSLLVVYLEFKRKQLKKAQNAQKQLSGMLISAQESERNWLALEIDDDFSQRIALLALELENAEESIKTAPDEAAKQIHALLDSTTEIGADLHALSHRLRSSVLEMLGLVPGITSLCSEFSAQQDIQVDFSHEDVPDSVRPEVSLCLFRIVQEGLSNLKKHSGVKKARVHLRMSGERLLASIEDEGIGFDVHTLRERAGLGIRSMEERAYLLGGRFEIHSQRGKGTRIEVSVRLQPEAE